MNLDLTEKIFLVTGGSRGIGRAIAKGLLLEGAKVAIIARQQKGVNLTVSELAQQFGAGQILGLVGDCADANSLSERVTELEKAWEAWMVWLQTWGVCRTQFQMTSSGRRYGRPTLRLL